ncbi:MAG: glycosyltransferase family 2 protein [Bacteroidaceae bacterium]|nr:glycosyltransferase family 2 protein [Bacteroidaceae bacterium]
MKDKPLVSIVVPVYNVKDYLPQCLDSLLAINYPSKEIIIVEDCSTDGSIKICSQYKEKYPELTLIQHKQNKGVQEARITGVSNTNGEYVMFVDSDDFVEPEILNQLVSKALQHEADMVCAQIFRYSNGGYHIEKRNIFGVFNKREIKELFYKNLIMDESIYKSGMPLYLCGKLIKKENLLKSLVKGVGLRYGEDELSVVDYLMNYTETLVSIDTPLYYYRYHSNQVTAKSVTELWPDYIKLWERLDAIEGWSWDTVLSRRMWCFIKPTIYRKPLEDNPRCFIHAMKQLRNSSIVKKHIFDNESIPLSIKKHLHYVFLKHRLYLLDYFMYFIVRTIH